MTKQYIATLVQGENYAYKEKTFTRDKGQIISEEDKNYLEETAFFTRTFNRGGGNTDVPYFKFSEVKGAKDKTAKEPDAPEGEK